MSTALYQLVTTAQARTLFNCCCQYSSQKSLTTLSCWKHRHLHVFVGEVVSAFALPLPSLTCTQLSLHGSHMTWVSHISYICPLSNYIHTIYSNVQLAWWMQLTHNIRPWASQGFFHIRAIWIILTRLHWKSVFQLVANIPYTMLQTAQRTALGHTKYNCDSSHTH